MVVHNLSWPAQVEDLSVHAPYYLLLNKLTGRPLDCRDWYIMNGLLIVDEAQASYELSSLWNNLIKFVEPGFGLRIAIFASYGSPGWRVEDAFVPSGVYFNRSQLVSFKRSVETDLCVLFSRGKFDDLVSRRCKSYGEKQPFLPSGELVEYIWEVTQGHAGAIVGVISILDEASELKRFRETASVIPFSDAMRFIQTDDFLQAALDAPEFSCGLVPMKVLENSSDMIKFLQEAVTANDINISGRPALESPLDICYTNGWLQAEMAEDYVNRVYFFRSPLRRW